MSIAWQWFRWFYPIDELVFVDEFLVVVWRTRGLDVQKFFITILPEFCLFLEQTGRIFVKILPEFPLIGCQGRYIHYKNWGRRKPLIKLEVTRTTVLHLFFLNFCLRPLLTGMAFILVDFFHSRIFYTHSSMNSMKIFYRYNVQLVCI